MNPYPPSADLDGRALVPSVSEAPRENPWGSREETLAVCEKIRQNAADRRRRRQSTAGSAGRMLTNEQVTQIRQHLNAYPEEPLRNERLAEWYGVSVATIAKAATAATYQDVEAEPVER